MAAGLRCASRLALPLLLAAAGCTRCAQEKKGPQVTTAASARLTPPDVKPAATSACTSAQDSVAGCEESEVAFPSGERVTVRLCRLEPRDEPGEAEGGFTRAELRAGGKTIGCVKLEDVSSLNLLCAGPDEGACLSRLAADNLAASDRFWAPRRFAASQLLVFLGDALESDIPSIEIVRVQRGQAQSVFYSEHDRTPGEFVFSRLLDADGDGVPEVLGWQRAAELNDCQPYIPLAIFKLGPSGYARDATLMEKWAREHGKPWHGPDPDDSISECGDDASDEAASPADD